MENEKWKMANGKCFLAFDCRDTQPVAETLNLIQEVFAQPRLQSHRHSFPGSHRQCVRSKVRRDYPRRPPFVCILFVEPTVVGTIAAPGIKNLLVSDWSI